MPIETHWEDEAQTIVRHEVTEPWSWDDFAAAAQAGFEHAQARGQRVDIVWNIVHEGDGVRTLPLGNPLPLLMSLTRLMPDNTGLLIFVNASLIGKAFGSIMTSIRPQLRARARFVDTLEEAHRLIAQDRA